jgi:hypothetical protein
LFTKARAQKHCVVSVKTPSKTMIVTISSIPICSRSTFPVMENHRPGVQTGPKITTWQRKRTTYKRQKNGSLRERNSAPQSKQSRPDTAAQANGATHWPWCVPRWARGTSATATIWKQRVRRQPQTICSKARISRKQKLHYLRLESEFRLGFFVVERGRA